MPRLLKDCIFREKEQPHPQTPPPGRSHHYGGYMERIPLFFAEHNDFFPAARVLKQHLYVSDTLECTRIRCKYFRG